MHRAIKIISLSFFLGCTPENTEIDFGKDQCDYCRMTISDPKFGAALTTDKGRTYKYDAIECMINHLKEANLEHKSLFAIPYDQPRQLRDVNTLKFVISPEYRSPMGENLAAFSNVPSNMKERGMAWVEVCAKLSGGACD